MFRVLTREELIIEGLATGKDAPLQVREGGVAGRGLFAVEAIPKNSWLCEYKTCQVYTDKREKKKADEVYDLIGEGS